MKWQMQMKSVQNKMLILNLTILVLIAGAIAVFTSDVYLPKNIRYLRYFILHMKPPDDLYSPIVKDRFQFAEEGFSRTYPLNAKYSDFYDFSIEFDKKLLSSKYKFQGKYKLEFLHNDVILFTEIVDAFKAWGNYFEDGYDLDYCKWIILQSFEIPLQGKYKRNVSIRITVLKPDAELNKFKDFVQVLIRPRSIH